MAILSAVNNSKENKVHVEVVEVSDYALHWITLNKFFVCVSVVSWHKWNYVKEILHFLNMKIQVESAAFLQQI